jgi:hypothetical protein
MYITCHKREKKGKKSTLTDNNSIIMNCHTPLHMEDDMMTHLEKRRKASSGHWMVSHTPSKWCIC